MSFYNELSSNTELYSNLFTSINDLNEWHKLFNKLLLDIEKNIITKNNKKFKIIAQLYYNIINNIKIKLFNEFSDEMDNFYLKYNKNINNFLNKLKKIYSNEDINTFFNIINYKKVSRKLNFDDA